ncbi:MAG TPA: malonic semialdehyde reductase [Pseudomonadota bacterium]|jgi:3-hydroxypropanoate dehydrogenase|nr:malonic semialdehyde reductase [Pseudomonadota bacterium]
MNQPLSQDALNQIFLEARTFASNPNPWQDRAVSDAQLEQIWNLARMGPTAANSSPARVVFVRTPEAKARLKPALDAGNVDKTMNAPVTAIVGTDLAFYEKLPYLFPHTDARSWFAGKSEAELFPGALRNSSLQGAYLIVAARSLGLDCGPMGGFDAAKVDAEFFAGTSVKSSFLINLGYGRRDTLHPRSPRLAFADACSIV